MDKINLRGLRILPCVPSSAAALQVCDAPWLSECLPLNLSWSKNGIGQVVGELPGRICC